MEHKNELFSLLENDISIYDKVYVIPENCSKIINKFLRTVVHQRKKVKIYLSENSTVQIPEGCEYKLINAVGMSELLKLYNMYEFSNRVRLIRESSQYASMFHYLSTGLLTEDELIEALLY